MRLAIGMPIGSGYIHAGHTFTFFSFGAACSGEKDLDVVNFQALDAGERTLNLYIRNALESEVDVLLIVHPDHFLPPTPNAAHAGTSILQMIHTMREANAAVIAAAGPARNRQLNFQPVQGVKAAPGEVFEVDRAGHGLMAINVGWIRQHWPEPPWFAPRFSAGPDLPVVPDDWAFCEGVRAREGKILCDGRLWTSRVEVRFTPAMVTPAPTTPAPITTLVEASAA